MDALGEAREIELELTRSASPKRAEGEKRYLKSDLDFLGTGLPAVRSAVKGSLRRNANLSGKDLFELADALWARPQHESRMAAVVLLESRAELVETSDLHRVEQFLREAKTWAYVDALAINVVGRVFTADPKGAGEVLDRWASDDDFWIRRSALLSQLRHLKEGGSFARFAGYADAMLEEREFFIRKAIGWVLREISKKRPDVVWDWIAPRAHRASGVTIREAVKYLGEERCVELMAAYKTGRPVS